MFKNQLQELAQRSCFNLPSYTSVREGPDHAPRFKASVNFNGEIFDSPVYSSTLRQAEHAAAEAALNSLSARGPSKSLTARVLDETGVYKNLLQETAHRAGLKLPVYTTVRSGPGHVPVFTSTVELAGMSFSGEAAKTKKQAEKNAAIAAWSALKRMPNLQQDQENGGKRVIRRRDQHQRRIQRTNQRDNNKKKSSFLSLLPPPPPPRAAPAIVIPASWAKDCHHPKSSLVPLKPISSSSTQEPPPPPPPPSPPPAKWAKDCYYPKTSLVPLKPISSSTTQESPPPPPPPPPTAAAAIMPANWVKDCHYPNSSFVPLKPITSSTTQEPPSPAPPRPAAAMEDCEWISKISEAIKKEKMGLKGSMNLSQRSNLYGGKQGIYNQFLDFSMPTPLLKIPTSCHNQISQRLAPAVQIRSVNPVCAAPPVRPSSNQSPPSKDAAPSSSTSRSAEFLASSLSRLNL